MNQMEDLRERTVRGGLAKVVAQGVSFFVRVGSLMILARLLDPKDFGLVGMVTAVVGVLNLFRDFGLSTASVQRVHISEEQVSTLFWINMLVGALLASVAAGMAPFISHFYREPALMWVTVILSASFLFNAAGVQHQALLQRDMRFTTLSIVDILSISVSSTIGILMALKGFAYWSLVASTIAAPLISTLSYWIASGWRPGRMYKNVGIRSMIRFGGTLTLNQLVVYVAYNLEKVLLGRYWGASVIGIYGRAYQLANIPTENLNSAVGGVVFSALSRLQEDTKRFRSYFLKGYSLVLVLTIPITLVCCLFAKELISVLLGPKWQEAVPIFRLLAPTIMIYALINPLSWVLFSLGLVGRSLRVGLVLAPLVIAGYLIGLPYGPRAVALAYSSVMLLWVIPHIAWCVHGTIISLRDILIAVSKPLASALVAGGVAMGCIELFGEFLTPLGRLLLGTSVLLSGYVAMLFYVMKQKAFYLDIVRTMRRRATVEKGLVPA